MLLHAFIFMWVLQDAVTSQQLYPSTINEDMPPVNIESSDDAKPVDNGKAEKCITTAMKGLETIEPLVRSVEETPEPISTEVQGSIPSWVKGNLLRNGPGKFEFGNTHYNHWFDGMALLHKFTIAEGQVTYMSRFLNSEAYSKNSERDRIMISEFGTLALPDPCKNIFQRFLSRFEMMDSTDNANVNFVKYKGDYYVSTETNFMHRVNPENLETLDKVDWSKFIAVNGATAHPHYDPDGTAYNMGNSYGSKDTLQGAKVLCSIVPVNKAHPSYYHSFAANDTLLLPPAMSENYVVFIEQPIKMDLMKIVTAKLRGKALSDGIYWDPKQETVFHLINAFEEDGFLMIDLCCADNGGAINNYLIQNLRKSGDALDEVYNTISRAFPRRFVLPLQLTGETPTDQNLNTRPSSTATCVFCQHEDLHGDDLYEYGGLEFPQINYGKYNTRQYRYFYGCGFRHLVGDSLLKMDLKDKTLKGFFPSEPVFVPSPDAVEEDEGDKGTFLLVLDAKTFEELARANVPVNMAYGFHGVFNATP
ncbi:hypothetical protein F7725_006588 [Dissostichus mawsoni]|uniref:Carotenoid-cleaving dioxygenase, mitochondrial n=1 Tax=Dissostichus mawsoni TaxID=36200 RepID=A0A7J5XUB3_DISMA|nr:hypothetical protein F7725_006588 [Dissostichus mawsoni]